MLGNAVLRYFDMKRDDYQVITTQSRWGDAEFVEEMNKVDADFIINCIGVIPQKKPQTEMYKLVNHDLPVFLETLGIPVIHPTTDCEFSGTIPKDQKYTKADIRNVTDDYGASKASISQLIEKDFVNTKMMRVSIIGHELNSHTSLLDWFLNSEGEVQGYVNHYWNGITTLEWAKQCEHLMNAWETSPRLNQYGTSEVRSKCDLLLDIRDVYGKQITVKPFIAPTGANKCLESDISLPPITSQLRELKKFYYK